MKYLGRHQLGDEIILPLLVLNSAGDPANPDAAPTCDLYDSSGTKVTGASGLKMSITDKFNLSNVFQRRLRLGGEFSTGQYAAVYNWTIGAFAGRDVDQFEIVAGGDKDGTLIAMHNFERPHAKFLIFQMDSGKLAKGRNPSI